MRRSWKRVFTRLTVLAFALSLVAGCGGQQAAPAKSAAPAAPATPPAAPAAPAAPAKQATAAPAAPAAAPKAPAGPPVKIKIASSTSGLDFAPIFVAREMGYFKDENIEMEFVVISGGAATTAALTNGEIQFAANSAQDVVLVRQQGVAAMTIAAFPVALDWNITARKEWAAAKGITDKSTIEQKIQALKGGNIGAVTVGGAPAQVARYMLKQYKLQPDIDVGFVAVGSGAARIAALKQSKVETIIGGIPDTEQPELEGWGQVLIRIGDDVPIFKNYPHEGLQAMEDYLNKNPDVVQRVVRALVKGNNLIIDDPVASNNALKKAFPDLDVKILEPVMAKAKNKFGRNMRMNQGMWDNAIEVLFSAGLLKTKADTKEGIIWTNKFLPN